MLVELSQDEVNNLVQIMDAGVKAVGLQGVKAAAAILERLEEASLAGKDQQDAELE